MRWIIASLHISHSYNYHFIMWLSIQNMTILVHNQQHSFQVTGNLFAWSLSLVHDHPASPPSHWSSNSHLDRVENRSNIRAACLPSKVLGQLYSVSSKVVGWLIVVFACLIYQRSQGSKFWLWICIEQSAQRLLITFMFQTNITHLGHQ